MLFDSTQKSPEKIGNFVLDLHILKVNLTSKEIKVARKAFDKYYLL